MRHFYFEQFGRGSKREIEDDLLRGCKRGTVVAKQLYLPFEKIGVGFKATSGGAETTMMGDNINLPFGLPDDRIRAMI